MTYLITRKELAEKLRVTPRTIRRWERRGLPVIHVFGLPRYELEVIKAWIQEKQEMVKNYN